MSVVCIRSFLIIIFLSISFCARKDSEPVKRIVRPANPALPGGPLANAPHCYTMFFAGGSPPTDVDYFEDRDLQYICQTRDGSVGNENTPSFYATLFNQAVGIAVFSAYVITPMHMAGQRTGVRCTDDFVRTQGIERKQGSSALYAGSSASRIDKGHLNPCQINSFSDDAMKATFQYTNAVPQYRRNNRGQWKKYETNIRVHAANYCCGNMHLITGTSRYRITNFQGQLGREIGPTDLFGNPERPEQAIRIPNSLWTAGCCVENGHASWSIAVMGNNDENGSEVLPITVEILENLLSTEGAPRPARLFPGNPNCRLRHHMHWN